MKKAFIFLALVALGGCGDAHLTNSQRCEHMHPDEMSPALLELCVAQARGTRINVPEVDGRRFYFPEPPLPRIHIHHQRHRVIHESRP